MRVLVVEPWFNAQQFAKKHLSQHDLVFASFRVDAERILRCSPQFDVVLTSLQLQFMQAEEWEGQSYAYEPAGFF